MAPLPPRPHGITPEPHTLDLREGTSWRGGTLGGLSAVHECKDCLGMTATATSGSWGTETWLTCTALEHTEAPLSRCCLNLSPSSPGQHELVCNPEAAQTSLGRTLAPHHPPCRLLPTLGRAQNQHPLGPATPWSNSPMPEGSGHGPALRLPLPWDADHSQALLWSLLWLIATPLKCPKPGLVIYPTPCTPGLCIPHCCVHHVPRTCCLPHLLPKP